MMLVVHVISCPSVITSRSNISGFHLYHMYLVSGSLDESVVVVVVSVML